MTQSVTATYSAVRRLEGMVHGLMPLSEDDPDAGFFMILFSATDLSFIQIRTYAREDIQILQTISQYERYHPATPIAIKLHKAERYDNRIFLVKTYHNLTSRCQKEAVCPMFLKS